MRSGRFNANAHFRRRVSETQVASFVDIYPALEDRELLRGARDANLRGLWDRARAAHFTPERA